LEGLLSAFLFGTETMLLNRSPINVTVLDGADTATPTRVVAASAVVQRTGITTTVAVSAFLVVRDTRTVAVAAILRKTVALTVAATARLLGSNPLDLGEFALSPRLEITPSLSWFTPNLDVTFGALSERLTLSSLLTVGGLVATYIEPQTDAILDITVKDAGALVTDATVTATGVWSPTGTQVASNVSMGHQGSGVYRLNIARAWSESAGKAVEGEFMAEIKAVRGGVERRRRFRYVVKFDDED